MKLFPQQSLVFHEDPVLPDFETIQNVGWFFWALALVMP